MSDRLRTALGWLLVVVLFAVAFVLFRHDIQRSRLTVGLSALGQRARDVTLVALDGKTMKLSVYFGHPLWVNFFATWCVPCKAELPEVEQRYAQHKKQGLIVLGVDEQESATLVRPFVRRMNLSYPITIDQSGNATDIYHVGAIPTSVFIGADGRIKAEHVGQMDGPMMDEDLKKIL